jgi:hypothetical protein
LPAARQQAREVAPGFPRAPEGKNGTGSSEFEIPVVNLSHAPLTPGKKPGKHVPAVQPAPAMHTPALTAEDDWAPLPSTAHPAAPQGRPALETELPDVGNKAVRPPNAPPPPSVLVWVVGMALIVASTAGLFLLVDFWFFEGRLLMPPNKGPAVPAQQAPPVEEPDEPARPDPDRDRGPFP